MGTSRLLRFAVSSSLLAGTTLTVTTASSGCGEDAPREDECCVNVGQAPEPEPEPEPCCVNPGPAPEPPRPFEEGEEGESGGNEEADDENAENDTATSEESTEPATEPAETDDTQAMPEGDIIDPNAGHTVNTPPTPL